MPVGGAAVAVALRGLFPDLRITETHPKVLYFHFAQVPYDFANNHQEMVRRITQLIGMSCVVNSEHGWDALVSAYAAREWHNGRWTHDLHSLPAQQSHEQLIPAHGSRAHYAWPTAVNEIVVPAHKTNRNQNQSQRPRDRWKVAVEFLEEAGHDDVAQLVSDYRNARGERSGWDSWLKSNFPTLWLLFEHADE
jgi:hypothetical protein